jgi:hypothetical protein
MQSLTLENPKPELFITWEPDFTGIILKTGYMRFESLSGVAGLAKVKDGDLHLLAVHADVEGIGQFRNFINRAKQHFDVIYVWEIWNVWLGAVLKRYGFGNCVMVERDGEKLTGMVWRKI